MERKEVAVLQLELKYCERCGGLWLRLKDRDDVYCASCAVVMTEVASGSRSRRSPRMPIRPTEMHSESIPGMPTSWEGGNA